MSDLPNESDMESNQYLEQDDLNASGIQEKVQASIEQYFENLGTHAAEDLHRIVLGEVEQPLLRAVLKHTRGNQTLAADMLGLNRGTLRKKLKIYGLS